MRCPTPVAEVQLSRLPFFLGLSAGVLFTSSFILLTLFGQNDGGLKN